MKYEILIADKVVSKEAAEAALAEEYPDCKVEVYDSGSHFTAKLTKMAADDEDEEGEEEGPPAKKKPPFLEEKGDEKDDDDDDSDEDDDDEPKSKKKDDDGDGDDLGFQDPDSGSSDVVKALKAVKTLEQALPKLKEQLKSLNGGEDAGPDGPDGGPGGPGGPQGLVPPPPPGPPKGVGPTPGAPPGAALPGGSGPPLPGKGIGAPNVNHGLDLRKGPSVGPSTFSHVDTKVLLRPVANADGSRTTMHEAAGEIAENPRYENYYVDEIKFDEVDDQWVARLKLR